MTTPLPPHAPALLRPHSVTPLRPLPLDAQIGNTPLLAFQRVTAHLPANVQVYAKAEWHNPGGSVKDRAALYIIRAAERDGLLTPGKTIMDSTSGNTGIAYAMLGAARGYGVKLFMPANVSPERQRILRAYGADVTLTDPLEGSDGAIVAVRALAEAAPDRYFYANQYNNHANWQAHYHTTALEVWAQTQCTVTHFVAGLGTTGTLVGTARRLKELNPAVRAIAMQPSSPFHGLEGLKHLPSAIVPGIYDPAIADEQVTVETEDAYRMARRLAREEGYLVGISAAANMVAALGVAQRLAEAGQPGVVVTVFCDDASKYLTDPFWTAGD